MNQSLVLEEFVEPYTKEIQNIMANAADLDVPLIADAGVGDNWDEAHQFKINNFELFLIVAY